MVLVPLRLGDPPELKESDESQEDHQLLKVFEKFEPEILQNITGRRLKNSQLNDKPKRPAGGDAREGS